MASSSPGRVRTVPPHVGRVNGSREPRVGRLVLLTHRIGDAYQLRFRVIVVTPTKRRELEGSDQRMFLSCRESGIEVRARDVGSLPLPHEPVTEHRVRVHVVSIDRQRLLECAAGSPVPLSRRFRNVAQPRCANTSARRGCPVQKQGAIQRGHDRVRDTTERLIRSGLASWSHRNAMSSRTSSVVVFRARASAWSRLFHESANLPRAACCCASWTNSADSRLR